MRRFLSNYFDLLFLIQVLCELRGAVALENISRGVLGCVSYKRTEPGCTAFDIVSAILFVRLDKTDRNVLSLNQLAILSLCRRQQRGCTCTNEACVV